MPSSGFPWAPCAILDLHLGWHNSTAPMWLRLTLRERLARSRADVVSCGHFKSCDLVAAELFPNLAMYSSNNQTLAIPRPSISCRFSFDLSCDKLLSTRLLTVLPNCR